MAAVIGVCPAFATTEYWVASNGSDTNPGTQDQPFQTVEMAAYSVLENDETIIHLAKDETFMLMGSLTFERNMKVSIVGDNSTLLGDENPGDNSGTGPTLIVGRPGSYITVEGCTLRNGRRIEYLTGGAIYFEGEELTVRHCTFKDNEAGSGGGAIGSRGKLVSVYDSYFDRNYTIGGAARGAAIIQAGRYNNGVEEGELYVENCTFANNDMKAGNQGTAIDIYDNSLDYRASYTQKLTVVNCTFFENKTTTPYQAAVDISGGSDCETYLINNTCYGCEGFLRLYFQQAPVYMFNNFAYCDRATVFSEYSIADTDRTAIIAHNNILYGKEAKVNENIDDPDLNAGATAANNIMGLCKDKSMVALGVASALSNTDSYVPFLPLLRANSELIGKGIDNSAEWTTENLIPGFDCRGFIREDHNDVGAYQFGATKPDSGIENIVVAGETDPNAPVEYYNLQGVRVANPANGLYIRRQGNNVTKVIL